MTKLAELAIPSLDGGYITLTEAAERMGCTRSYVYKKASRFGQLGGFESLKRIGSQASYVVLLKEVDDLLTEKEVQASIKKGLAESAAGDTVDLGSFVEPKTRKPRKKKEPSPVIEQTAKELTMEEILAQI